MTSLSTRKDPDGIAHSLRDALVQPSTWNDDERSFEVIWTTGAAVTRFDWWDGEFYDETLSVEAGAVRLDRLQAGGPVLLDHVMSTENLAGSIVPGSVRLANGKGIAKVRLADTPALADVISKVRDGHLRTVSVGYLVHAYKRQTGKSGERAVMHAVDWEPLEISLTPVPADPGATVRNRSNEMPTNITDQNDDQADLSRQRNSADRERPRGRVVTEDRILQVCSRAGVSRSFERSLIAENEADPMSEAQITNALMQEIGARHRNQAPINPGWSGDRHPGGSGAQLREVFTSVIYSRLAGKPVPENARDYAGASIADMARALLEEAGEQVRWARAPALIDKISRAGAHSTSDFAAILDSAGQRFLVEAFNLFESPLKVIARKRTLPDFRKQYGIQAEGPSQLLLVGENSEFKRSTFVDAKNGIQLNTYGRIFSITRQALINDDLGVFLDAVNVWARAQAELEGSLLTALIAGAGVTLEEDGKALFHADHGNLAGSGSAISVASLGVARQLMREQKNRDKTTIANVVPKYLVVGPAKETEAEQVLAATAPTQASEVNPFSGKLTLVVDPRQTGNSWRLFAEPTTNPVVEVAELEGQEGLYTDTRMGFDVDGVEFKARMDIGAAAMDYRGAYMNPGN